MQSFRRKFSTFKSSFKVKKSLFSALNSGAAVPQMFPLVQLDFTPEIEVIYMLSERCHTKDRKSSIKQHIRYFNFRSKIHLDHPVALRTTVMRSLPADHGNLVNYAPPPMRKLVNLLLLLIEVELRTTKGPLSISIWVHCTPPIKGKKMSRSAFISLGGFHV